MTEDRIAWRYRIQLAAVVTLALLVTWLVALGAFHLGRHVERVAHLTPALETTLLQARTITAGLDTLGTQLGAVCWQGAP